MGARFTAPVFPGETIHTENSYKHGVLRFQALARRAPLLLILDDLAYVTKDQAETSALFELISARYERRSMLITANQPFGEWGKIFPDQAMTLAAIDRLVHHATILEMNVESYRRRSAQSQPEPRTKRGAVKETTARQAAA